MVILTKIEDKTFLKCIHPFTTSEGERVSAGQIGAEIKVAEFIMGHIRFENSWADEGLCIESYVNVKNSHIHCDIPQTLMCLNIENNNLRRFPKIINANSVTFKSVNILQNNEKIFTYDAITISDLGKIHFRDASTDVDIADPFDDIFTFLLMENINPHFFKESLTMVLSCTHTIVEGTEKHLR